MLETAFRDRNCISDIPIEPRRLLRAAGSKRKFIQLQV